MAGEESAKLTLLGDCRITRESRGRMLLQTVRRGLFPGTLYLVPLSEKAEHRGQRKVAEGNQETGIPKPCWRIRGAAKKRRESSRWGGGRCRKTLPSLSKTDIMKDKTHPRKKERTRDRA